MCTNEEQEEQAKDGESLSFREECFSLWIAEIYATVSLWSWGHYNKLKHPPKERPSASKFSVSPDYHLHTLRWREGQESLFKLAFDTLVF